MTVASNIVRLPTAPKRKVQQNYNRAARAERAKLPQFTGEYLFPGQREALERARLLQHVERNATMELLTVLLGTIDDGTRLKLIAGLAAGIAVGRETAKQALAVLDTTKMTYGQLNDMRFAVSRLNREGC